MAKKSKPFAVAPTCSPSPRGAIPLGQVMPELAIFAWDLPASSVREIADAIAKDLEMHYQLDLLERSGFGRS